MFAFVAILTLVACNNAEGDWVGTCTLAASGYTSTFSIVTNVTEDMSGDLGGTATASSSGYSFSGTVDGTHSGKDVDMTLDISGSGFNSTVGLTGELDGDTITGDCNVNTSGYGLSGNFTLTR